MDGPEFYNRIDADPDLEWLGCRAGEAPAGDHIYIKRGEAIYEVDPSAVLSCSWEDLRGVLVGDRWPSVMTWMTRVVGYFSFVRNWNKSKLAELRDRRKGNYGLEAA